MAANQCVAITHANVSRFEIMNIKTIEVFCELVRWIFDGTGKKLTSWFPRETRIFTGLMRGVGAAEMWNCSAEDKGFDFCYVKGNLGLFVG